jgi:general stress protein 26
MSEVKHLHSKEAIAKLKKLVLDIKTCFFCTHIEEEAGAYCRPMATQEVDEWGNIWFLSDKGSDKNCEIQEDSKVQLFYADPGKNNFIAINGHAEELFDKQKTDDLWTPLAKTWLREGKDDPNISLIRVKPESAYYWDTKGNRMINFIKMLASAATGTALAEAEHGEIQVKR